MARAVAVLVLICAAVMLVAAAHAGRVLEYQALEAGLDEAAAALAAASPSPAPSQAPTQADVAADAGGGGVRRDGRERRSGAIADVLWFVLQWANEAATGDRRKAY